MDKRGKRICNVRELPRLAAERRAVIGKAVWCKRPIPAAFVLNMSLMTVLHGLALGMWVYEKGKF